MFFSLKLSANFANIFYVFLMFFILLIFIFMFIFNFLIFYFFKFPALASLISAWLGGNIWLAAWQSDVWNDLLKDTSHHYWRHVTSLEWNDSKEKRGLQSKLIWLFSPLFGITKTCKFWRQVDTREWKVPHEQNQTDLQNAIEIQPSKLTAIFIFIWLFMW